MSIAVRVAERLERFRLAKIENIETFTHSCEEEKNANRIPRKKIKIIIKLKNDYYCETIKNYLSEDCQNIKKNLVNKLDDVYNMDKLIKNGEAEFSTKNESLASGISTGELK